MRVDLRGVPSASRRSALWRVQRASGWCNQEIPPAHATRLRSFALDEPERARNETLLVNYFVNAAEGLLGVDPPGPVVTTTE